MIVGGRRPGFYMRDVVRNVWKPVRWVSRDSLGEKRYERVDSVEVVTDSGRVYTVTLHEDGITISAVDGRIVIYPRVSNVIEIATGKEADF